MTIEMFINNVKNIGAYQNTNVLLGMITQYCIDNDIELDTFAWDNLICELWSTFENDFKQAFDERDFFDYAMGIYLV